MEEVINLIGSKEDLKNYMEVDKLALERKRKIPFLIGDDLWKLEIELRKCEYNYNCHPFAWKLRLMYHKLKKHKLSMRCGVFIPLNVFQEGLCIVHCGTVVVSGGASVGKNCRIHEGVTIGATNGSNKAATIGKNCFIGSGAKIIGDINIGDNVAIGAGAVVVNDIPDNVTVGGVPAKIISNNDSSINMHFTL